MGRIVMSRHGQRKVELGKDEVCGMTEHRGWGTNCEYLVLQSDGFYHCNDCGLVFKKPHLEQVQLDKKCPCKKLENFLEWIFNECFGYECPHSRYRCQSCGRIYQTPFYNREAPLKVQETTAAKEHVAGRIKDKHVELEKKKLKIRVTIFDLKNDLKFLPKKERERLLKELTT